jgi:transcriptional regulator with XRE-family HTH domain
MSVTLDPADLAALGIIRRAARDGTARRVRELAGVSLEEVARSCGVEPQTVLRWELGRRSPRAVAAERYTAALIALAASLHAVDDPNVQELRRDLGIGDR